MPRYMLDTDTCSYIMKRSHPAILKRLQAIPVTDIHISVISKSELLYGVEVSPRRLQDTAALKAFLPHVGVLEFPDDAALHYAQIRADLKTRGQRSFDRRSRTQPWAQARHEQHRRVQPRERADAGELDARRSSFSFERRRITDSDGNAIASVSAPSRCGKSAAPGGPSGVPVPHEACPSQQRRCRCSSHDRWLSSCEARQSCPSRWSRSASATGACRAVGRPTRRQRPASRCTACMSVGAGNEHAANPESGTARGTGSGPESGTVALRLTKNVTQRQS